MIKKLKDILNAYSDEELENMDLWINSDLTVDSILIDEYNIDLLTHNTEVKVNERITKEAK